MQQSLSTILTEIFEQELLIKATFSNPRKKTAEQPSKVGIRPVKVKETILYQLTEHVNRKDIHRNVSSTECLSIILETLIPTYKQAIVSTGKQDYHLLTNKKGETTILKKSPTKSLLITPHNRKKNYILSEESPLPFLIELGIMNSDGKIPPKMMDKFRQINRFLEMVEDTLPFFDKEVPLEIVDFGCGKAYLTFALHHYLKKIGNFDVQMVGLDLKADVINDCQRIAGILNLEGLSFKVGNITDCTDAEPIDMVVALHACDTATDAAIANAIRRKSKVILAAPCCQHELYNQVTSHALEAVLHYGILKERFAAIATDAARAQMLEMYGYSTQVLEFIDSEHTPKNLLIRATFGNTKEKKEQALLRYRELVHLLKIKPALELMLGVPTHLGN